MQGEGDQTELSEIEPRVKLVFPIALEWRNWQTQQTQNLPPVTRRGGSTPPSSTSFSAIGDIQQAISPCAPGTCPRHGSPHGRNPVNPKLAALIVAATSPSLCEVETNAASNCDGGK